MVTPGDPTPQPAALLVRQRIAADVMHLPTRLTGAPRSGDAVLASAIGYPHIGHPLADRIRANDLWIAATAIHTSATLITTDSVFIGTPGLALLP